MKKLLLFALLLMSSLTIWAQGSTSASMSGKITDFETKESLIGANVVVTHIPSGTVYGGITDIDGFYRLIGMRVGGPYRIEVGYVGFEDFADEGIYLNLGQNLKVDGQLSTTSIGLEEIVISAGGLFDGTKTGAETVVDEEQINALPTVSRAIGDFTRLTPQSRTTEGNDGLSLSFAGQNNRYNSIYIDGAISNDVFGLAGSGTNGGQTGVSPISVDAIEEFQVNLAPFDVTQGGFGGAAINAITRSGTNNLEGSVYTYFRNQSLAGRQPTDDEDVAREDRPKLNDFTASTTGFRLGGALIENKLFYFINAEIQRETTPLPFDFGTYIGDSNSDRLDELVTKLQGYGYDPGTYIDNERFLDSEKYNLKIDYNINDRNKLAFKLSHVHANNLEGVQSDFNSINFLNSSESFDSKTTTASVELNTLFNSSMSNNLIVGYSAVRDDRDPTGSDFPYVFINDGSGGIAFGSERFSTANLLNQDILTITNNLQLYKGKHTFTFGTHNEFYAVDNLFIARNFGDYEFDDLQTFLDDGEASDYERNFSLVDNLSGDESAAVASFTAGQLGLYAQDKIQVTDNFQLTAGLRLDLPFYSDTPGNEQFNTETIALIEAEGYDLRGAEVGEFIQPQLQISPRIGFNWDINGDNSTQLRGGAGIFTSRAPLVWVGGAFNNYGLNVGTEFNSGITFDPNPQNQPPGNIDLSNVQPSGSIDLFAEDFKLPQFLKLNLALDHKLSDNWTIQLDGLFNKTLQNVAYQNVNLKQSIGNLSGTPDDRPIYDRRDEIDPTYGRILLGYNTTEGYSYNATISATGRVSSNMFANVAYSYGDAFAVFDGTSSQNSSQWRGLHSVGGRNFDQQLSRSDFSPGSRFIAALSRKFNYLSDNLGTTITLFHESVQGTPYSYIYNDNGNLTSEDSRERSLIYIPETSSDIILVDDGDLTAADQWAALDAFIENDPYLSENRGNYAERNSNRGLWSHVMDLKILQDVGVDIGNKTHKFQVSLDIFNVGNLVNNNWGRRYFVGSFGNFELLNFEGFQDGTNTPTFSFDPSNLTEDNDPFAAIDDGGIQSSRWQMQIGLRYLFD